MKITTTPNDQYSYQRLDAENLTKLPSVTKRSTTWVCWKEAPAAKQEGKARKIPINPLTGKNAKSNQPSTGGTYDQALAYFIANPEIRGIGFILSRDNELCAIDADHCIDPATGAMDGPTTDLIRLVDSYTERTPSGDGVHILVLAKLGSGSKFTFNGRTFEIYDHDRFLTVTGKHLPNTSLACWDRQQTIDSLMPQTRAAAARDLPPRPRAEDPLAAAVDAIPDAELIHRIEESDQGAKFQALMAGSTAGYAGYFPASGALCVILASWTRLNTERIDRIARTSGLIVGWEKWWDELYGDRRTRGERTIAHAVAIAASGWKYAPLVGFLFNDNGNVKPLLANAVVKLRTSPEFAGVLAYNEFSLFAVARKAPPWPKTVGSNWTDVDDLKTTEWLQKNGVFVNPKTAGEAVQIVADENRFHPVQDYMDNLTWDGTKRLDTWLTTYLGVEETDFSKLVGSRWLISAVARIYQPGCRADHTLILEGPQGIQKSTALRTLAVKPEWFTDDIGDLSNKDALLALHGVLLVELAELSSVRRSQVERVKSFLTSPSDYFRPPFGHRHLHVPRTNIFAGSVNEHSYLTDETGGRRFWPVICGKIDIAALTAARDQIWAEARKCHKAGDIWWLGTDDHNKLAATEQESRYESGVWDDTILPWLDDPKQRRMDLVFHSTKDAVTITEVLIHAIAKDLDKCTQADRNQVARCLRHAGWTVGRKYIDKEKLRFYERPKAEGADRADHD